MNERIRELAEQAGVTGHFAAGTEYATLMPLSYEVQKFAELIVQECAKIAEKEQLYNAQFTDANLHPQINIDQCILMNFGL